MKTWITYLSALFLALATALLFGDTSWILAVLYNLNELAINLGLLISVIMVIFSMTSAVASLRKDRIGGKIARVSILWAIVTGIMLPLFTAVLAAAFPVGFPVSSTAGSGSISTSYLSTVFATAYESTFSGSIVYMLSLAQNFLLPTILLAFIVGMALKPNADAIKPAYITLNSFSEVMFRLSRALNYFGYLLIYFTASYFFTVIYQEKTFFVNAAFSTMLVACPIYLSGIILPILFEIFTKGKGNPYKILYRNTASQLAALTSGNYIFALPFMMGGERYNDGVQKRIAATTAPMHYLISRGGSASIATFSIIAVIAAVTGEPTSLPLSLVIALCAGLASFASSLSAGFEIMFITVAVLKMLNINLYSAEITMLGLLPLLSGLGCIVDSQIAILGASIGSRKIGVDATPGYKDIL